MAQLVFLLKKSHNFFTFIFKKKKFYRKFYFCSVNSTSFANFWEKNHELFDIAKLEKTKTKTKTNPGLTLFNLIETLLEVYHGP